MTGTLLIRILSTCSSYKDEVAYEAKGLSDADTIQAWIGPVDTFMIHTHAYDRDIRVFRVDTIDQMVERMDASDARHYGDITVQRFLLTFSNVNDPQEAAQQFATTTLEPTLHIENGAFAFWHFGDIRYRTVSSPM
ncbi:MAG: hypothetical protein JST12_03230 [Armatimonadetes bacterium]|nr:hypothetical protein [Armatimonadota bacterium]